MKNCLIAALALLFVSCIGGGDGVAPTGDERIVPHVFSATSAPPLGLRVEALSSVVTYDGLGDLKGLLEAELTRSGRAELVDSPDAVVYGVVQQFEIQIKDDEPKGWRVKVRAELKLLDGEQNVILIVGGVVDGIDRREGDTRGSVAKRALTLAIDRAIEELPESLGG